MSARDKLIVALRGGDDGPSLGIGWEEAREVADRILAMHAHELAEKIRAAYAGDGPDEDNWIMNPYDAADLIDPEVPGG